MIKYTLRFITLAFIFMSTAAFALPPDNANVISHSELIRVITGLLLVLGIIVLLSWLLKKLHGVNLATAKGFESIGSMTLGPKEKMMLVKVGGRYMLVGVGSGSVNLLYDYGKQLPEGFDPQNKPTFAELLKSAVGKS